MRSFKRILDKYDIASEVRFERATHEGTILVVEGGTDIKRFVPFMDEHDCSIINAYGREKAIGAVKILSEEGFAGVLACVDSDFDRMLETIEVHENILYSIKHDFDLDWIEHSSLKRYCVEVADPEKLNAVGGVVGLDTRVKTALLAVSVVRLLNRLGVVKFKVKHVDVGKCFVDLGIDFDHYFSLLSDQNTPLGITKEDLQTLIEKHKPESVNLDQITNGHDLHCAIGASLQSSIGDRRQVHTWGSEVEMHIRLTFSDAQFMKTDLFRALRVWEADNDPYLILATHLQVPSSA